MRGLIMGVAGAVEACMPRPKIGSIKEFVSRSQLIRLLGNKLVTYNHDGSR